ncbi:hypothetical protein BC830DRAFT_1078250 [Chytriomyces sp. MP71]|nr:hypothetical protein BC830DRAFT_1078250 [Chytriomyces sp. MP71]
MAASIVMIRYFEHPLRIKRGHHPHFAVPVDWVAHDFVANMRQICGGDLGRLNVRDDFFGFFNGIVVGITWMQMIERKRTGFVTQISTVTRPLVLQDCRHEELLVHEFESVIVIYPEASK